MKQQPAPNKALVKSLRSCAETYHGEISKSERAYTVAEYVDLLRFTLIALIVLIGIMTYIIEPIPVSGESMETTLHDSERILVIKTEYWFSAPEHGDVIICFYPDYELSVVKRVIGLPGDTLSIHNSVVYLNGEALDESDYWAGNMISEMDEITVPADHVFVMGDNRNHSHDSRSVGAVPFYRIIGHARAVVWPLRSMRGI